MLTGGWVCPAAGHGAWGDHRGVPGGPAEPQLERAKGCPVSEGTTTSCPLWFSGTLKPGSAALSHSLPPLVLLCPHPCLVPLGPVCPTHHPLPSGGAAFWVGSAAARRVPQSAGDVRLEPRASRLPPSGLLWPCPPQVSEPHILSPSCSPRGVHSHTPPGDSGSPAGGREVGPNPRTQGVRGESRFS